MDLRLSVSAALLLWLYVLGSQSTVKGQPCPITEVDLRFYPEEYFNFRDVNDLTFVVNGNIPGAVPSTLTWKRNGGILGTIARMVNLPGITNGTYYIGGNFPVNDPCERADFRTAIQINGRAPGEYSLTVKNNETVSAVTRVTTIYDSNPVTNLMLIQFDDVRLRASWTAPVNTGIDKELVDYRVFINDEDINSNGIAVPAGNTMYVLPGTYTPNTTVTVHVRATSRNFWSTTTTARQTTLGFQTPVVTLSSYSTLSVSLTMTQPNTPGLSANQYTVTLTSDACPDVPTRMEATNSNSLTVGNLEAGIQYTANVIASNTNYGYNSEATTTIITTQETVPDGSPGSPTSIATTSTTITLSWTTINCIQRNGNILYFIIHYGEGTDRNMMINTGSSSLTYMIFNLKPYTEYTFTVAGATSVGTGPASAPGIIRTNEDVPTAVRNLMITSDLISLLVTWSEPSFPNGVITNYTITYSINGSSIFTRTSNATSFKITGLQLYTTVSSITVTARTRIGPGPTVSYQDVTISEGLPRIQNVRVMALTDTSVRVSWDDPQFSSITYYEISCNIQVNMMRQTFSLKVDAPATSAEITGLIQPTAFQVTAVTNISGILLRGEPSMIHTSTQPVSPVGYKENTVSIIITAVAVFIGTIALYSVVLGLGAAFCIRKKHVQGDSKKSEDINITECEPYENVKVQESDQHYKVVIH